MPCLTTITPVLDSHFGWFQACTEPNVKSQAQLVTSTSSSSSAYLGLLQDEGLPLDLDPLLSCADRIHSALPNFLISGLSLRLVPSLGVHSVALGVHLLSVRHTTWLAQVHFFFLTLTKLVKFQIASE